MVLHVGRVVRLDLEAFATFLASEVVVVGVFSDVMNFEVGLCTSLEVAQTAGVFLHRVVVYFHVSREISAGLESLGANGADVRPRVAVFVHVAGEFALAIEDQVANFAGE